MVVVRIRQMVALGSVSGHSLLWGAAGTHGHWSLEVGGRLIQVVVKAGFTVFLDCKLLPIPLSDIRH